MRHLVGAALAAAVLVSVRSVHAAASDSAAVSLSLQDAVARARASSPLVRLARRDRDVVASGRVAAGVLLPANPAVTVAAGARRDRSGSMPPARGPEVAARLEQAIEVGGQRGTRRAEAERHIDDAAARQRLAEAETVARVRAAYVGMLIAGAHAASAAEREALGSRLLAAAQARVQAGAAGDVELRLAESEAGRLTHERMQAELAVDAVASELRRLVDLPPDRALTLTTALAPPPPPSRTLGDALAEALARRAELRVLDAERTALDATLVRLRREVIPSPTLFVELQSQQPGQLYLGAGVALPIPVWRRNQGELARVRAEEARVDEAERITARDVTLEVTRLYRATAVHRAEAALWTDRIVPSANATVELVRQGWSAGKFDLFRLVQVSREAGEARRMQLEVLAALWGATIELDRATGAL